MKITRKQLKRLISEAIINEMPMIKPGGEMDPDHLEKITKMINTGEEDNIVQADQLASMVGHDSDHLSQDLRRYDQMSIMGAIGEFAHYLTDEDIDILMNVRGEDLYYGLYGWAGQGFGNMIEGGPGVSPEDIYPMGIRIAAKKKDIDEDDFDKHEGMKSGVDAYRKLSIAIMKISNKTIIDSYNLEDLGIGEEIGKRTGQYEFWYPEYKKLWQEKKLIIRGYEEPSTLDLD